MILSKSPSSRRAQQQSHRADRISLPFVARLLSAK
jgi:hypothetical protein